MPMSQEIVRAYCLLWNENDERARTQLLDLCCCDASAIYIGDRVIAGKSAIAAETAQFRARCPDDKAVLTSGIAFVGRWFRFTAEVRRPDGSVYSRMLDVGELSPDGRIRTIITFVEE